MCGIAAIIDPGVDAEDSEDVARREAELVEMLGKIRHRGDPSRFAECWSDQGVALGTNRLAIVDRENARQPQTDDQEQISVVYNGELYDFAALRDELAGLGHKFRTRSDTEVLVHAHLEWGEEFLKRLDGMYAFVLYDHRRRTFLAARDHIGIKPLYYAVRDRAYYFASEQKCLLHVSRDIRPVPPGTFMTKDGPTRYFTLTEKPCALPERTVVARYRDLFVRAVRKQVDTDLPVAVMFSGGIDSAAVLHVARQYHPSVTAFTVGFEGAADVEVARRYCAEFDVPHVVSYLDRDELIGALPEAVYGGEFFESIDAMDTCVGYFAYRLAKEHGFKVALCGEGSDEVLAGYDLFKTHEDPAELMKYRVHNLHRTDLQRVDRSSMLHSIETRVPFMDRSLLEFAYSIPMHMKLRDGVEKWVLREAFKDTLPSYIANRPKIRMPDGSGLKDTLREYARQNVDPDRCGDAARALNIDTPEGVFFLSRYIAAGFPTPHERFKRPGYDYSPNGYFQFIS
jgi:asparagine synthase (glutamine-hydrolysing)